MQHSQRVSIRTRASVAAFVGSVADVDTFSVSIKAHDMNTRQGNQWSQAVKLPMTATRLHDG